MGQAPLRREMAQLNKTYSINLFSQDQTTWPIYTTQIDTKSIFVVTRIFFYLGCTYEIVHVCKSLQEYIMLMKCFK